MGRVFWVVMVVLIILLSMANIYTYMVFSRENLELKNKYMLKLDEYSNLERSYSSLQDIYKQLKEENEKLVKLNENLTLRTSEAEARFQRLINSYNEVLKANKDLAQVLEFIANKLIVLCNYTVVGGSPCINYSFTLMGFYEFLEKYIYAYDEEMVKYVYNITGGWDGTEEDFQSDLYRIYEAWRNDFSYVSPSPAQENLTFIMVGTWWYSQTEVGDHFLKEVRHYGITNSTVWSAQVSFQRKAGTCWDYATVLVTLYYVYYDIVGRNLPTGYLSISFMDKGGHRGCVIIKEHGDRVAIIDWDVITREGNKIIFLPFEEAKKLHEEYWSSAMSYDGIFMRTATSPYLIKNFSSNEEFYNWLIQEFN
ncbi:MAG: hypothetical protein QXP74_08150 [Nitrososphaerota archaeon]